jgi:uncharacterized protein YndB with AHSA1/START domain
VFSRCSTASAVASWSTSPARRQRRPAALGVEEGELARDAGQPGAVLVDHPRLERDAAGRPHEAEEARLLRIVGQRRGLDQPVRPRGARRDRVGVARASPAAVRIATRDSCCLAERYKWRVAVDVACELEIPRPREEVAAYAADPDHTTEWYANIKAVEWETPRPLAVGSRLAFVASFLGRRLSYTYEIRELVPGERLVMSTAEGPFPMETTYTWEDAGDGATRMTMRNRGEPSGFAKVGAPVMARAMKRAMSQDLQRLSGILTARPPAPGRP